MLNFLKSVLEIFGIVYLRFRLAPRIWCVWLVGVNAACLFFITHIEAQVVLAVTAIAVVIQAVIYQRNGFIRLMGTAHILWVPMFAWMATRLDVIAQHSDLSAWLWVLLATNVVSFGIDAIDSYRFFKGERAPFYHWSKPEALGTAQAGTFGKAQT